MEFSVQWNGGGLAGRALQDSDGAATEGRRDKQGRVRLAGRGWGLQSGRDVGEAVGQRSGSARTRLAVPGKCRGLSVGEDPGAEPGLVL